MFLRCKFCSKSLVFCPSVVYEHVKYRHPENRYHNMMIMLLLLRIMIKMMMIIIIMIMPIEEVDYDDDDDDVDHDDDWNEILPHLTSLLILLALH